MGYSVEYVVRVPGKAFNAVLPEDQAATASELHEYVQHGLLWECRLPGSEMVVASDLSSDVAVLVSLPISYSRLVTPDADIEATRSVEEWENVLKQHFSGVPIVRVDEFLIREWSSQRGESWLSDSEQVERLFEWLKGQDSAHWKLIQP